MIETDNTAGRNKLKDIGKKKGGSKDIRYGVKQYKQIRNFQNKKRKLYLSIEKTRREMNWIQRKQDSFGVRYGKWQSITEKPNG